MAGIVKGVALVGVALGAGLALGGCSTTAPGGAGLATLSVPSVAATPVPSVAALTVPSPSPVDAGPLAVPVSYGDFLGGPVGAKLPDVDRAAALAAENGALASGERRTWKGAKGVFGYVVPGPPATAVPADGEPAQCRSFTATVFFAGRPQVGHGTGCRDLDGNWHVTS